jgi:hypothetical protein
VSVTDDKSPLKEKKEKAQDEVDRLEALLDDDEVEQRITSILNRLSRSMTEYASQLELANQGSPYRLDINKLTVVVDESERVVPMDRVGGGENYLGMHIITMLALHKHFISANRPVPQTLFIDQPSQVYFPSKEAYRAVEGDADRTKTNSKDILAVGRLFDLLFSVCEELHPNLQIIITEHANLDTERFQNALVEDPWVSGRALIPGYWLREE